MKGIILFDNLNDLAFIDADDDLTQHIQSLAFKDGLLEDLTFYNENGEINKDVVMQLFSPLIASYKVMQVQFGNKYKYIESEDGVLLFFSEILNYIAIFVCHKDDGLENLQKELALFNICVEVLFGPSLHMIKENISTCCDKVSRSDLLPIILKKWRFLRMEQQMFLVEAIERLIINQEITALCINLLQEILEKIRYDHKEATYSHAFLIVDTKLLALYSSRNAGQLPREILLLLILLVHTLKSASENPQEENTERDVDDEFFIPVSLASSKVFKGELQKQNSNKGNLSSKLKIGAQSLLIYLKSHTGILVPHILYVIEVAHNINLVILSEFTQYTIVSSSLSSLCKSLHSLQSHPSQHTSESFEAVETHIRSLVESMLKMKSTVDKERHIKRLISKWEQLKQCDIEAVFQVPQVNGPRLESSISSMCDVLKNIFEEIVAIPCLKYEENTLSAEHQETLQIIQKIGCRRLLDVGDFLEVKAMQNITMASYISEYPGLIHFIYVDRNSDCLIAPSIHRKEKLNGTSTLKKKIWNMVSVGRRYLDGANKFCCLWKDDDLYFLYTIWFENSSGKVMKPTVYPNLKKFPQKGIVCGNFFKKLVLECFPDASHDHIFCYEIFCVHLDSTPIETIVDHSRKLCAQLWDFTGAYRTSLDLL